MKTLYYASLLLAATASSATAQDVRIESLNGKTTLAGEMISNENGVYTIETNFGIFTINAADVRCSGDACSAPKDTVTFVGSPTMAAELVPAILTVMLLDQGTEMNRTQESKHVSRFQRTSATSGSGEFVIEAASSTRGIAAIANKTADFALASRPANQDEVSSIRSSGYGELRSPAQEVNVALDALTIVANSGNPVDSITEVEVAAVFAGEITNWSSLGGPDEPITIYGAAAGTGTGEIFADQVLTANSKALTGSAQLFENDSEVTSAILQDPWGIGFSSYRASGKAKVLDIEGACGLRTPANDFTIKTEEYPFAQNLYVYSTNENQNQMQIDFLDYALSDNLQNSLRSIGFVDQRISLETINGQGYRIATAVNLVETAVDTSNLRRMMGRLQSADRISSTLRFNTGASQLNAKSLADLDRLATFLSNADLTGKELLFVGYTDDVGKSELNEFLSLKRAELAKTSFLERFPDIENIVNVDILGAGEILPVACNDTNEGRSANRRVEIWLADAQTGDRG